MQKKKHLNFYKKIKNNFYGIYKVNNSKFFYGCGSYLITGKSYRYDKALFNKQLLLYNIVKKHNTILEIGVYMAHSMLIMLTSNPKLNIYGIDIDKKYSLPSINYLQKKFPKSKLKFLEGDSIEILKKLKKKFDLFHIDGDHQPAKIYKEIIACSKLTKNKNMKILFDDVDMMKSVEKSIVKSFKVKKYIKPISKYRNLYLEIVLDKKSFRKFMILFYFFHLLEVQKIYLIPILKTMIRKVIIIIFGKKFCNYFGKLILNNFSNIYFIMFAKKLINIYKENRY